MIICVLVHIFVYSVSSIYTIKGTQSRYPYTTLVVSELESD